MLATEIDGRDGLHVRGSVAWYGQTQVLFGVDVHVQVGEIVGLFGHNGAGKSTLLRVIAGLHRRATYSAALNGVELARLEPHQRARDGLFLVREGARVFEGLTVEEHLQLGARLGQRSRRGALAYADIYEHIPILHEFRHRLGSALSGGQRQLLALGMAFISNPTCLLLDEPSTGLAPIALDAVRTVLQRFSTRGVCMLITEQNPAWLAAMVTRAYLLELGHIEAEGPPSALLGVTAAAA